MTENTTPTQKADRTMSDVSHTHPDTDRPFGERVVFARGPTVAADGGERSRSDRERHREGFDGSERGAASEQETDEPAATETDGERMGDERMEDVDHEPPTEAAANRVFERGREGRDGAR